MARGKYPLRVPRSFERRVGQSLVDATHARQRVVALQAPFFRSTARGGVPPVGAPEPALGRPIDAVIDPLEVHQVPVPVAWHAGRRRPPVVDHKQVREAPRGHLVCHRARQLDLLFQRELVRQRALELAVKSRVQPLVEIGRLEHEQTVVRSPRRQVAPAAVQQIVPAGVLPASEQVRGVRSPRLVAWRWGPPDHPR